MFKINLIEVVLVIGMGIGFFSMLGSAADSLDQVNRTIYIDGQKVVLQEK